MEVHYDTADSNNPCDYTTILCNLEEQEIKCSKATPVIIGSFACCAWGIISKLTTIKARLLAGDIGGIEDTIDSVIIISIVIVVITVIVNLIALGISFEKNNNS